jgi:histone acetyltransferase (RNA polymerase elongator complex component)
LSEVIIERAIFFNDEDDVLDATGIIRSFIVIGIMNGVAAGKQQDRNSNHQGYENRLLLAALGSTRQGIPSTSSSAIESDCS